MREIFRKKVSFVLRWKNIEGGKVYARIEFAHQYTDWLTRSNVSLEKAESVGETLLEELKKQYSL